MKIYLIIIALSLFITAKSDYDLHSGVTTSLYVKAGITYTAYINAKKGQTAKIEFSMDNSCYKSFPFTSIYVYELKSKYFDFINYESISKEFEKRVNNNRMVMSANYYIRNYNCTYIRVDFTPEYNINDLDLKITVEKPSTVLVILVILIPLLCCIFCVIGIICVIRCICTPKTGQPIPTYIPIQPIQPPQPVYQYPTNQPPQYYDPNQQQQFYHTQY